MSIQLSIAIPTHEDRWQWTRKTIKNLHDDRRVSEIVLVDDCSPPKVQANLRNKVKDYSKVRLLINDRQELVFRNKFIAVANCRSSHAALLDSDNIFGVDYLDAFFASFDDACSVHAPMKALPRFDFSKYRGIKIDRKNVGSYMSDSLFRVLMNTGNYVVNRNDFIGTLEASFHADVKCPSCADVLWMNYHLLTSGKNIMVVPNMIYEHIVHRRSTYGVWVAKEPGANQEWENRLTSLSVPKS